MLFAPCFIGKEAKTGHGDNAYEHYSVEAMKLARTTMIAGKDARDIISDTHHKVSRAKRASFEADENTSHR